MEHCLLYIRMSSLCPFGTFREVMLSNSGLDLNDLTPFVDRDERDHATAFGGELVDFFR